MDPIKRLLGSSKALVMLMVTLLMFVGVFLGKIHFDEVKGVLTVLVPVWLGAQGIEDAAKNIAVPSNERVVKAAAEVAEAVVKASVRPPPAEPPAMPLGKP